MIGHPGNPFVDYLVALRTQTDTGNVFCVHEARGSADILSRFGLDPADTHVQTKVDALVEDATSPDFPFRIVFLTGDAGDGKTAACEALAERLFGRRLSEEERRQQRLETHGGAWTILKDASELNASDNPSLNFEEILARECVPSTPKRLFVAVNEGRLRSACHRVQSRNPWLWSNAVEPVLAAREGTLEHLDVDVAERAMRESRVLVLNLRDRCLPADPRTFDDMLESAVSRRRWEDGGCHGCPFTARCHILSNASTLRQPAPRQRLRQLLLAAHDAGAALPFRRLQGFLAYTITGGYCCAGQEDSEARVMRQDYTATEAVRARYYNLVFGVVPTTHESTRPEPLCRLLGPADPAKLPAPELDRLLGGVPDSPAITDAIGPGFRSDIEGAHLDTASDPQDQDFRADFVRYLKRLVFFERDPEPSTPPRTELSAAMSRFASRFPWESFSTYDRCMVAEGRDLISALAHARSVVIRGLNALDDPRKATSEILSAHQADPLELSRGRRLGLRYLLRREPVPRVDRLPVPPPSARKYLEYRPAGLTLQVPLDNTSASVILRVDLGLYEMLFAGANGFSAPQAFGTYLLDVRRFKERLIDALASRHPDTATSLIIAGAGRDFIVSVTRTRDGDRLDVLGG